MGVDVLPRVNLLPPEIHERQRTRRGTLAVIAGGILLLLGIGAFYVLQVFRLGDVEADIAAQEGRNAELQAQISELQEIQQLQTEIAATRDLVAGLLSDRVLWSGVLRDVSLVIPGEAWLSGLTGTTGAAVGPEDAVPEPTTGTGLIGSLTFNGTAFEHRDVALWLSRLEDVRGFVNPWVSSSTKSAIGSTGVVQFTSSVDLSEQVLEQGGGS